MEGRFVQQMFFSYSDTTRKAKVTKLAYIQDYNIYNNVALLS